MELRLARLTVADLFAQHPSVIELGAGTGAVGLASALLGASSAILTDLPHLVHLLEDNVSRNSLGISGCNVSVAPLPWGCDPKKLNPPFDLILASDVVYQEQSIEPLIYSLRSLCGPHSRVFFANEHRAKLPFPVSLFATAGFSVELVPIRQHHPEWRSPDIQIYSLSL